MLSPNTLLFTPQIPFPNPSPTTALTTSRPHPAQSIRQPSYQNVARRWTQTSPEAPATSPMPLCEHNISTIRIPGPPVSQSFAPHENGPRHYTSPPPCLGNALAEATPWRASPMPRDAQRPFSVVALWVGCTDACMARCPPAVRRKLMHGYVCVNVYIWV